MLVYLWLGFFLGVLVLQRWFASHTTLVAARRDATANCLSCRQDRKLKSNVAATETLHDIERTRANFLDGHVQ